MARLKEWGFLGWATVKRCSWLSRPKSDLLGFFTTSLACEQFGKCSPACISAASLYDLSVAHFSQFAFLCYLGSLFCFLYEFGSWDWEAIFSAICSLPWHIAISKGCQDHHISSQFNFQNCLNSSELQSLWIWA